MDPYSPVIPMSKFLEQFSYVALRIPGLFIFELWFRVNWVNNRQSIHSSAINDQVNFIQSFFYNVNLHV